MSVYRVFFVKEVLVDADSFEDAVERAIDEDYIMCDEYLDEEQNATDSGREDGDEL